MRWSLRVMHAGGNEGMMSETPRSDEQKHSPRPRGLDRLQSMKWERAVLGSVGLLVVLIIGVVLAVVAVRDDPVPAAERPNTSPIDSNSSRPPDDPALAPNDDPAADSDFGIEAQKLLYELRSHSVPFTDADANILVDIGDKNVARGDPDLAADDPAITDQLVRAFPQYSDQQRADTIRCLAEYVEQTIAKNRGTVPPDGYDHN